MLETRHPYPAGKKCAAYAVTRGLVPGVYLDWYVVYLHTFRLFTIINRADAKAMTDRVSNQVVVGYHTLAEAQAAYGHAVAIGAVQTLPRRAGKKNKGYNYAKPASTSTPSSSKPYSLNPGATSPAAESSRTQHAPAAGPSRSQCHGAYLNGQSDQNEGLSSPPGRDKSSDEVPWYLRKAEAWRGRKAWITVFRGSDVGVFDSWIEASGWVLGVKGALWNGFLSAEQAHRAFNDALEDRIVEVLCWQNDDLDPEL